MFEEIIARISKLFNERSFPYMIIGGQAVLLYGEPRLTRDIDITLGLGPESLDDLLSAIKDMPLKVLPEDAKSFVQKTMVLPSIDEATGIRVDFIFSFTPYESEAIKRAKFITIKDQQVRFASPEDVVIHKIFAGRPRDMEDVRTILLKNPNIDVQYIRLWLKEFDAASDEKIFLKSFEETLNSIRSSF